MKLTVLFIAALFIIISCTTLKRYSSAEPSGEENTLAGIDLFGIRLTASQPVNGNKTLWDLSADAQSQFIKILNTRYPDNEKFLEAMSFEYLTDEKPLVPDSYVKKDLRMIFSISRQRKAVNKDMLPDFDPSPADRIEYLKVTLSIPHDSGVRFTGWNMFTTEYGTIDIADVSFNRSLEIDASGFLSSEKKVSGGELSAGGKSSYSRREDQEIRYRYLKLNGRINSNALEMEEDGTRELDLTGNIMADVALEFGKFPEMITDFTDLTDSSGRYNEPAMIGIQHSKVMVPAIEKVKDTLFAELKMDYLFRNVVRGHKTFPEWDDRVKYYSGSVSKKVPLFTAVDYVPDFYCIGTINDSMGKHILKISAPDKEEYSLVFSSYNQAAAFMAWLSDHLSRAGSLNKPVVLDGFTLKFMHEDLPGQVPGLGIIPYYL